MGLPSKARWWPSTCHTEALWPATGSLVTITWPEGGQLVVTVIADDNLSYQYLPRTGAKPSLTGILGTGNTLTQIVDRDGAVLPLSDPDFHQKLYSQFANSWRVSQASSLFDYGPGQSTATFTDPKIPYYPDSADASLSAAARPAPVPYAPLSASALSLCSTIASLTSGPVATLLWPQPKRRLPQPGRRRRRRPRPRHRQRRLRPRRARRPRPRRRALRRGTP